VRSLTSAALRGTKGPCFEAQRLFYQDFEVQETVSVEIAKLLPRDANVPEMVA
jgi:hypothetical protein